MLLISYSRRRAPDALALDGIEQYVFAHHASHASLVRARRAGCTVCNAAWNNDEPQLETDWYALNAVSADFAEQFGCFSVFCVYLRRRDLRVDRRCLLLYDGGDVEQERVGLELYDGALVSVVALAQ